MRDRTKDELRGVENDFFATPIARRVSDYSHIENETYSVNQSFDSTSVQSNHGMMEQGR